MSSDPRSATVSFVVPVRDDAGNLRRCLASIEANRNACVLETMVVDNGSIDDSATVARQCGAVVVVDPEGNVAELRNKGASLARGEILAFVDADHAIATGWVTAAVELLARPGVGIVGAPYVGPGKTWVQRAYDRFRSHRAGTHDVEWLGSGNLAIRRELFQSVGAFDTALETCEDVDLCGRVRQRGCRIVADDRLGSVHFGDPSTLRALFAGELWRGRDNFRVTLRGPLTLRALPSLAIPLADVVFLAATVGGALTSVWIGPRLMVAGLAGFLMLSLFRAARMTFGHDQVRFSQLPANLAVASVYDLARALALVVRASHRVRRTAQVEPSKAVQ